MPEADKNMTLDDFKAKFDADGQGGVNRERLTILCAHKDSPQQQIFVFWAEEEKLGVKPIKGYVDRMQKENINRAILILKKGITPFARRIIMELAHAPLASKCRFIELFEESELLVNITQHCFVPPHILLTPTDKTALLQKYKLKDVQLPRIQQVDPIARFFGLQKGQVVKIIRPSETAGRYVTYRLVC